MFYVMLRHLTVSVSTLWGHDKIKSFFLLAEASDLPLEMRSDTFFPQRTVFG